MKFTAIVIDDQPKLRAVFIAQLAEYCPKIEVVGQAGNITDGYTLIVDKNPCVVFLDIEMPGGNGFELLQKFEKITFEVVFISSYGHYAIRALRLSAIDFLLKPVLPEDLVAVPARLKESIELKENALKYKALEINLKDSELDKKILVNSKTKLAPVNTSDIIYLKADGNYTTIFVNGQDKMLTSKTLKEYEEALCDDSSSFMRIHKAIIVNLGYVCAMHRGDDNTVILKDDTRLEISRRKKALFLERFNNLK